MNFVLLLKLRSRAVIEIDGGIQHHSSESDQAAKQQGIAAPLPAAPARYAATATEDRELTVHGYEVYGMGGHELCDHAAAEPILTRCPGAF
ncbi:hypothetical protein [Streptomyces sp. NPDC005507]|uniref:hypothetical protein n=1 Tax=Streptomyces sp. NPDC005507 TaxID=3154885 RepID=UPI0033B739F9